MKSFLSIFLGSIVGGIIYVCATFNFFPQDSGEYFSFGNTILIIGLFSSVAAIVLYVMGRVLKIKADNPLHLGTAALVTQLAIWGIVHMSRGWGDPRPRFCNASVLVCRKCLSRQTFIWIKSNPSSHASDLVSKDCTPRRLDSTRQGRLGEAECPLCSSHPSHRSTLIASTLIPEPARPLRGEPGI
jgi:hypothetical protein